MADLSNLLGAVYGESAPAHDDQGHEPDRDPDGPPTPVEKAASERTAGESVLPLADDLAAALSEALVAHEASGGPEEDHEDIEDGQDSEDHDDHAPSPFMSPQRAAAVELSEALRPAPRTDSTTESVPAPTPAAAPDSAPAALPAMEPIAVADLPYATDGLTSDPAHAVDAGHGETPRGWERSHDDILPTKGGGKKFFSLSLKRG